MSWIDLLWLPDASVAIIRAYSVAEKLEINLTDEVVNVARCTFSNCITINPREPLRTGWS